MSPLLKESHISENAVFDELLLEKHPGQIRLNYAINAKIEALY